MQQKEKFNYQKVSSVLADYGFITLPLSDDWNGADFLAIPIEGEVRKVQLKSRLFFAKKYVGKNLYICFPNKQDWYMYSHDELLKKIGSKIKTTSSWTSAGGAYSYSRLSVPVLKILEAYRI